MSYRIRKESRCSMFPGSKIVPMRVLVSFILLVVGSSSFGGINSISASMNATEQSLCIKENLRIVLDIGHTPSDPGATSSTGVPEYEFNSRFVAALEGVLLSQGFTSTSVINRDGEEISLPERVQLIADESADLLISIHHDSVQEQYMKIWYPDGVPRKFGDRFRGFSLFVSGDSPVYPDSKVLATEIGLSLIQSGLEPSLHHGEDIPGEGKPFIDPSIGLYRFDNLVILRDPGLTGVLIEVGVIVHRYEEMQVRNSDFINQVSKNIARGIYNYCMNVVP